MGAGNQSVGCRSSPPNSLALGGAKCGVLHLPLSPGSLPHKEMGCARGVGHLTNSLLLNSVGTACLCKVQGQPWRGKEASLI